MDKFEKYALDNIASKIPCINCGNKITDDINKIIAMMPLCKECRKTRVKRKSTVFKRGE